MSNSQVGGLNDNNNNQGTSASTGGTSSGYMVPLDNLPPISSSLHLILNPPLKNHSSFGLPSKPATLNNNTNNNKYNTFINLPLKPQFQPYLSRFQRSATIIKKISINNLPPKPQTTLSLPINQRSVNTIGFESLPMRPITSSFTHSHTTDSLIQPSQPLPAPYTQDSHPSSLPLPQPLSSSSPSTKVPLLIHPYISTPSLSLTLNSGRSFALNEYGLQKLMDTCPSLLTEVLKSFTRNEVNSNDTVATSMSDSNGDEGSFIRDDSDRRRGRTATRTSRSRSRQHRSRSVSPSIATSNYNRIRSISISTRRSRSPKTRSNRNNIPSSERSNRSNTRSLSRGRARDRSIGRSTSRSLSRSTSRNHRNDRRSLSRSRSRSLSRSTSRNHRNDRRSLSRSTSRSTSRNDRNDRNDRRSLSRSTSRSTSRNDRNDRNDRRSISRSTSRDDGGTLSDTTEEDDPIPPAPSRSHSPVGTITLLSHSRSLLNRISNDLWVALKDEQAGYFNVQQGPFTPLAQQQSSNIVSAPEDRMYPFLDGFDFFTLTNNCDCDRLRITFRLKASLVDRLGMTFNIFSREFQFGRQLLWYYLKEYTSFSYMAIVPNHINEPSDINGLVMEFDIILHPVAAQDAMNQLTPVFTHPGSNGEMVNVDFMLRRICRVNV